MSKPNKKTVDDQLASISPKVNGRFFSVAKDSHLLYLAYEIVVKDGQVVEAKCISRAPDLGQTAVAQCQIGLWEALRNQDSKDMKWNQPTYGLTLSHSLPMHALRMKPELWA